MASTTTNNNSTSPSSQAGQFSFTGSKPGSALASLAKATEPNSSTSHQQQASVATFPQRLSGGSSTVCFPANTGSPIGASFASTQPSGSTTSFSFNNAAATTNGSNMSFPTQPSGDAPRFSFNSAVSGDAPRFSFNNAVSGDGPRFSFNSALSGNPPEFSFNNTLSTNPPAPNFNQSKNNSEIQQPLSSYTFTPSTQKQDAPNNNQQFSLPTNNPKQVSSTHETMPNNMSSGPKTSSSPTTPIAQQPSLSNQEQEENDTPASLAECSLISKMVNKTLRDPTNVVIDRSDPLSPLYSTKSFEQLNLNPDLLKGIYSMNFRAPSKIQEITLPHLLNDPPKNIIAQSQSGTGKTAAFSIATISRIDPNIKSPQALILAPTFELALQIGSVIENIAKFLPYIQIAYAVRDQAISKRAERVRGQLLREPIVVGTPGTVEDWCRKMRIIDLQQLNVFVVDEADVMIATGDFRRNCSDLVKNLNISHCQLMLFSATYSDEVMTFAREIVPAPVVLRLKREKQTLNNIYQYYICCYDLQQKYQAIEQIYTELTVGQAMIFCRTKRTADELATQMSNQNHSVGLLTGDLTMEQRAAIVQKFREGQFRVLVSDLQQKYQAIEQIYTELTVGQAMIFCRTKRTADELATQMSNQNHSVGLLTGDLTMEQRAAIVQKFREGQFRVLVSTNVTARGIDIEDVSLVINYDVPTTVTGEPDYETYLHRIGRCGRFGKIGYTFNLIGSEKEHGILRAIEKYFSRNIQEITIEDIGKLEADQE
ncbi:unnamed protein product [Adineta steineri]|uniref:RNA helicase n=1 Tax=Adineta steineri TaxID=433720 RepID=A0A815PG78_9BILA|nr:unnamed protein product [Adineta steineri]